MLTRRDQGRERRSRDDVSFRLAIVNAASVQTVEVVADALMGDIDGLELAALESAPRPPRHAAGGSMTTCALTAPLRAGGDRAQG